MKVGRIWKAVLTHEVLAMVMTENNPKDEEETLDLSFQNHTKANLRKGRHPSSNFRRTIFDGADLTAGDFTGSDFRRASMFYAD